MESYIVTWADGAHRVIVKDIATVLEMCILLRYAEVASRYIYQGINESAKIYAPDGTQYTIQEFIDSLRK